MIQLIGLMIGAYIFTRMIEVIGGRGNIVAKVSGVITILIVAFCLYGLVAVGNNVPAGLR